MVKQLWVFGYLERYRIIEFDIGLGLTELAGTVGPWRRYAPSSSSVWTHTAKVPKKYSSLVVSKTRNLADTIQDLSAKM